MKRTILFIGAGKKREKLLRYISSTMLSINKEE